MKKFIGLVTVLAIAAMVAVVYAYEESIDSQEVAQAQPEVITLDGDVNAKGKEAAQPGENADTQRPTSLDVPQDRLVYIQITDAECRRLNLEKIFEQENPAEFAATGGDIDLRAYFGLQRLVIKPIGGVSRAKPAGWLVPSEFFQKYGKELRGSEGWEKVSADSPRPQWLRRNQ